MPLPVVTPHDLHLAQLNRRARRILHKRAAGANRREAAPILAADRAAFSAANQAYRTEAQAVRGSTGMVQNSLAQALRGLQGSGLKGGYLKQAQRELTSRQADTASSIPFLLADAAKERSANLLDARQQLIQDRAQMQSSTAADFNSLLAQERDKASTVLKDRESETAGGGALKSDPRALHIALMSASKAYAGLLQNSGKKTEKGTVIHPPQTEQEWWAFVLQTARTEGVDPLDAAHAVKLLRERIERKVRQGNLKPLGIVFNAG